MHRAIGASEPPPDRKPIVRALKGLNFSYHTVVMGSPSWESVSAFDPYFEGVRKVGSVEEFRDAVLEDRILSKMDIETYINSVADVSPFRLHRSSDAATNPVLTASDIRYTIRTKRIVRQRTSSACPYLPTGFSLPRTDTKNCTSSIRSSPLLFQMKPEPFCRTVFFGVIWPKGRDKSKSVRIALYPSK